MAKNISPLNAKQLLFIDYYLVSLNATQAAIQAGYSERSARSIASDLLTKPDIQKAIDEKRRAKELELEIEQAKVLSEVAALAFSDFTDFCDLKDGEVILKDLDTLPRHFKKAIKKVSYTTTRNVTKGRTGEGDEVIEVTNTRIELHDKLRALEFLGKYFGMLEGERGDDKGNGKTNASAILSAARKVAEGNGE